MSRHFFRFFLCCFLPLGLCSAHTKHTRFAQPSKTEHAVIKNALNDAVLKASLASMTSCNKAVTVYIPDNAGGEQKQALAQMGRTLSAVKNLRSLTIYGGSPLYAPYLYDTLNSKSLETLVLGFNGSFSYKAMLESKKQAKGIYPLMHSYYPVPLIKKMPQLKKIHYKGLFYTSEYITDTVLVSRGPGSRGVKLVMDGASTPAKERFKNLDVVKKAENLDKVLVYLTYKQSAKLSQENEAHWKSIRVNQKSIKLASH